MTEYQIEYYLSDHGRAPFVEWLENLKDHQARAKIRVRLDRLEQGNFGDCQSVGEGVFELRIHFGPGYRVYFGREGIRIVILLCGGTKKTQSHDITRAKEYWRDYKGVIRH